MEILRPEQHISSKLALTNRRKSRGAPKHAELLSDGHRVHAVSGAMQHQVELHKLVQSEQTLKFFLSRITHPATARGCCAHCTPPRLCGKKLPTQAHGVAMLRSWDRGVSQTYVMCRDSDNSD